MFINNKSRFEIKLRIMLYNDTNFRYKILISLLIFKSFMIVIYVACFVNLFINIKIISQILLMYEFLADDRFVIKFNIII